MARRLTDHVERATRVTLNIDGRVVSAYSGETLATILFAEQIRVFYRTSLNQPRAPFCNMGTCYGCQVRLEGTESQSTPRWVLACMTPVEEGMVVATGFPMNNVEFRHDEN